MTQKQTHLLQDYVPRPESIKHQISELSWKRGIDNFFLENVPFSYSTGLDYANRIISILDQYAKNHPNKAITLLEIGSGSGLLAYRILDLLYKQKKPYAKKLKMIITDFSEEIINQIKDGGLFKDYLPQVTFDVFNFITDSYEPYKSCQLVLMTYLLDSVSYNHLKLKQGKLYETKIKTTFDRDYCFVDTSQFPPLIYKDSNVQKPFLAKVQENDLNTLSRSSRNLYETYKDFPVKNNSSLYNSDLLSPFIKRYSDKTFQFNFSNDVCASLNKLFSTFSKDAVFIIYDFGVSNFNKMTRPNSKISAKYGVTLFHSIFFPLISFIAEQHQLNTLTTQYPAGDSQCCLITKSTNSYKTMFESTFKIPGAQNTLKIVPLLSKYKGKHVLNYIEKQLNKCSTFEKHSHTVLLTIAILLKKHALYDEALTYIKEIYHYYGEFSLSTKLLEAEIYSEQNKYDKTISLLEPLTKKHRFYNGFYYQLCVAYINLGQKENFISTYKKFLYITDNFIPWRFFIIMACYYYELKQFNTAEKVLRYLIMSHSLFPDLVEHSIAATSNDLLKQWKRTKAT